MNELQPRPAPSPRPLESPFRIERSDLCINCGTCIEACIYGCHERSQGDPRVLADPKSDCCRNCFACVLRCPRGALSMRWSPCYRALGNTTYTPAAIRSIREQAEQGKIPVSGSGYGGLFDGEGYDNIWTDMSEIVRPTRDGIHGRERISTTIRLGRVLRDLCGLEFDADGDLHSEIPPNREIPLPILFALPPWPLDESVQSALALAATKLTTYTTIRAGDAPERFRQYFNHLLIQLSPNEVERFRSVLEWATIVEFDLSGNAIQGIADARAINPHLLTIVRLELDGNTADLALKLVRDGAETLHLAAGLDGRGGDGSLLLDGVAAVHDRLVQAGLRNQVALLASGGVAAAEHVPKLVLMGADGVMVDLPLLIAMDLVAWDEKQRPIPGGERRRATAALDARWGATRVINLLLSWRDQLLEVLGAMGLRDLRRLRGERGRAIFADRARAAFAERLQGAGGSGESEAVAGRADTAAAEERPTSPAESTGQVESTSPAESTGPAAAPGRFATDLARWRVAIDRDRCTGCELCVAACPEKLFRRTAGKTALDEPRHSRCHGPECAAKHCLPACPWEAIAIERDGSDQVLGDARWTPTLMHAAWETARDGRRYPLSAGASVGASGGGFDHLRLALADPAAKPLSAENAVDLSIPLNRRDTGPKLRLPFPIYGGGMSYGSISLAVMRGRAMAAAELGTFTCTGEGGYPDALRPYSDHVITQIATGLFGIREETILRARIVEFKYAQGAKPGLGGHLLGEKNTPAVAAMREAIPGTSLFSPFPFHSVYSVEDHKKHLDWIRAVHPDVLISVKVSTPGDVDMVAVGSYHAGANIVHLDGAYGGTGAAPNIAKKNIAQPLEYATAQTHEFLVAEGIRDQVVLIASGGIRSPEDLLKAIALGADGAVIGTAELIAIDCVRCGNCERDRGCPIGIATTDPLLAPQLEAEWVAARIVNLYRGWVAYIEERLRGLGMTRIGQLRGRWDLLQLDHQLSCRSTLPSKGGAQ
jgi:glutamate synthase domain-containing protein 2